jgi:hypothetical protein
MKAKEFLKQIRKYDLMIENWKKDLSKWKSMACSISSPGMSETGVRVQTSGNQQQMEDSVIRYVDMEAEIEQRIRELTVERMQAIKMIEHLKTEEYDLLHKIYVQGMYLNDVAEIHGKSYNWATTVHGRALKNVQTILNERKICTGEEEDHHDKN